ncbi:MAG: hypothetical protein ACRD8A_18345, partial [Candidatus Acidiferrales bacterium]
RKSILVCTFLIFAGCVPASHADTYYQVISNVTFDGTNACGGQCVETLNGSFELDVSLDQSANLEATIVPGSVSFMASGPLGPLNCCTVNFSLGYIAIGGVQGQPDEFDIDAIANTGLSGGNGNGTGQAGIYMYSCESSGCVADFTSSIGTPCFNCATGRNSGTVTFSIVPPPVATPEPTARAFLLFSIPVLLFWVGRGSRFAWDACLLAHSRATERGTPFVT